LTASSLEVGVETLIILFAFASSGFVILTTPVPSGDIMMFPFVFTADIVSKLMH
jgi:hypothetical protein